jgi:hypothetical protein
VAVGSRQTTASIRALTAALTLHARTPAELEAVSDWVQDSWLDGPVGPVESDGTLRLTITKDPAEVAVPDPTSGLPQPRNHRVTEWYEECERPLVECVIAIGHVVEIVEPLDDASPLFGGAEYTASTGLLDFDDGVLTLRVAELDVQLDVMPEPVGWRAFRDYQRGPLRGLQSSRPAPE